MFAMIIVGVPLYFRVEYKERGSKKLLDLIKKNEQMSYENGCDNITFQNVE
jgi:hypothetical protein